MPDNSSERQFRKLAPSIPGIGYLLLFWLLAVGLPALAILTLLNSSELSRKEQLKNSVSDRMLDDMNSLLREFSAESYFSARITQAETAAGLPPRHSNLTSQIVSVREIHQQLHREFSKIRGLRLITIISGDQNFSDILIDHDNENFADYPKPGQWAARTILKAITARAQNQSTDQTLSAVELRMLRNFNDSIFGSYFNPVDSDEDFNSGFITRNNGSNLHTARRVVVNSEKEVVFSYLAIFVETAQIFTEARQEITGRNRFSEFAMRFVLKPATAFPFLIENRDSSLSLYAPVSFGKLNAGAHAHGNLIDRLIAQGKLTEKPAQYPHLVLSSRPLQELIGKRHAHARMLVFLVLCASLLVLKHFQQTGMLSLRIRVRLFAAVFLATILPATAFMFSAYRHNQQQTELRQTALIEEMKTRLKLFELNIRSQDEILNQKAFALVDELNRNIDMPDEVVSEILTRHAKSNFAGAMLIRNNGLSLEIVDRSSTTLRNNPDQLTFSRDIYFASMIKFFDYLGLILENFYSKLESTPNGRKLKALSAIFTSEDVENFCSYEGSAQTTKKDSATLRFSNFKIIPHGNKKGAGAAVLLLVQDIRKVIDQILADQLAKWSFYDQPTSEGRIRNMLAGTFDLEASSLDLSRIWPAGTKLDSSQKSLIAEIANGKAEVSRIISESDAPPVAMVAAKIGGYPLIAISRCTMQKLNADNSHTDLFLLASFAWLMIILMILVSLLDELFATPINRLLTAVRLTEKGYEAEIINDSDNELAQLTGEFNLMNRNLKERERLARFISHEAAQTISRESRELSDIPPCREERSILFIHIRGFSEFSERLSPEQLIDLLNRFFPFAEKLINEAGGQIDKYIADAIMAVFSDGENELTAAVRACMAAQAIRRGISRLNHTLAAEGLPGIALGAGIASGEVISGRIGATSGRRDYTVIGDRVNLAARLETMSHFSDQTRILVDEQTKLAAAAAFSFKNHGELPVKGKTALVQVYELHD